ncbi:MAG: hypothetical protein O3A01_04355 [bacterium]|nr:hypothetical protein [bacterium]
MKQYIVPGGITWLVGVPSSLFASRFLQAAGMNKDNADITSMASTFFVVAGPEANAETRNVLGGLLEAKFPNPTERTAQIATLMNQHRPSPFLQMMRPPGSTLVFGKMVISYGTVIGVGVLGLDRKFDALAPENAAPPTIAAIRAAGAATTAGCAGLLSLCVGQMPFNNFVENTYLSTPKGTWQQVKDVAHQIPKLTPRIMGWRALTLAFPAAMTSRIKSGLEYYGLLQFSDKAEPIK